MRPFLHSLIICVLAAGALVHPVAQAPPDASAILAAAREALGGEKRLSAVRSFVATGRTRQVRGDNLVPIEFEISCELPDRYIRRDEIPAQESGPTTIGFNGATLIQLPVAPPMAARAGGPPAPNPAQLQAARNARVTIVKQDFARLMLGMFAASFSSYPLTFNYVGEAEAPQGKADVLDVTAQGPPNFAVRLFVYRDTRLPIMLSWQAQVQGKPVEQRLYFADYRDVDGMKFPFRLRRAIGADTTEETVFDRFRINPKIDPRRFEVK